MPSAFTHALVGLGLAEVAAVRPLPVSFCVLSMGLAAAPDLDVLAFNFGIPYGALFGHRGFAHSLPCALLAGLLTGALTAGLFPGPWWLLAAYFVGVVASHGLLDGFTNGGLGIAFFSPFDRTRYFFPWTPIQVAPLGLAFFSPWGLRAVRSEIVWVWLPLGAVVAAVLLCRRFLA
jgi:inner membrane protein